MDTADNAYGCECTCEAFPLPPSTRDLDVCLPLEINPGRGGRPPTTAELERDCTRRVVNIAASFYLGALAVCGGTECPCRVTRTPFFGSPACNAPCPDIPLDFELENEKEATSIPVRDLPCGPGDPLGDDLRPVCRVPGSDPPGFPPEGAYASFLPASSGRITAGTATITIDELTRSTDVRGEAVFPGTPCPGASCQMGTAFRMGADPVELGNVLGLFRVQLEDIAGGAAGTPGELVLGPDGRGTYAAGAVQAWGRTTVVQRFLDIPVERTTAAFVFRNTADVDVELDWEGRSFAVRDEFRAEVGDDPESTSTVTIRVDVEGVLDSQPPTASIATTPVVECTSPDGAVVVLDSSASFDRDGDLAARVWRLGAFFGGPDTVFARDAVLRVMQAVNTEQTYSLLLLDQGFQTARAEATVRVQDTTPPVIDRIALSHECLWSPNHKFVRFLLDRDVRAPVSDACDTDPVVRIVEVRSSDPEDGLGDGATRPDVLSGESGFCIRSERSGTSADGRVYTVVLEARDHAGNAATSEAAIRVPHDGEDGCALLPGGELLSQREAEALCLFGPVPAPPTATPQPPRLLNATVPSGPAGSGCAVTGRAAPHGLAFVLLLSLLAARRRGWR